MTLALLGAASLIGLAVAAPRGVRADALLALANADFEAGAADWGQWSRQAGPAFVGAPAPDGSASVTCDLLAGQSARLWQSLPVGTAAGQPREGDKLELGLRVWPSDSSSGVLWCEVLAAGPSGGSVLARSAAVELADLPRERGSWIASAAAQATGGRVPAGCTSVSVVVHVEATGPLWIERVECGRFEYGEWPLAGQDFEATALHSAWQVEGQVGVPAQPAPAKAYRGGGFLRLGGSGPARARQALALQGEAGTPAPGRESEACAWLLVPWSIWLPGQPSASHEIELSVRAWEAGTPPGSGPLLARASWRPTAADRGSWRFLQTEPSRPAAVPFGYSHVVFEVAKNFSGNVRVDYAQLGERFGVNGNPRRQVTAHYVGSFRSPLSPDATTQPEGSAEIWRNWHWTASPLCDETYAELGHDPECATSPACLRPNGRRDGAVTLEESLDDLPLAGTYDSRDRDLLRYHMRLAKAAGLDSFTFLHQGHTLAGQRAAQGFEPLIAQAYEALLDVAEEPDVGFKIALMYEPKVHFLGWVQGEPTLAAKRAGIVADLVQLIETAWRRKAALQHDGRLVVFLFRNDVCDPAGEQCLSDADWFEIKAQAEQLSGHGLFLIADVPPADGGAFSGLSRWSLTALPLLRYRSWSSFVAGQPAWPPPDADAAASQAQQINQVAREWAARDDSARLAVAIAWPGFDDSGVAGWGAENGLGSDGRPLCVRVVPDLDGAFFAASLQAARDSGADWLQIATWNDWNERTQVEPRWNRTWAQSVLTATPAPPDAAQQTFDRLLRLRATLGEFKHAQLALGAGELEAIAADYLLSARNDPSVVEYD